MRRIVLFAMMVGFLIPVLAAAPARAQAGRTWVSGGGDDGNPCSRASPCKTFAAAIAVTSINGEIDCIDSGGYGTLTIVKSITIDCTGNLGAILATSIPAIVINIVASSDDPLQTVRLRGLSLTGEGLSGTVGTRIGTRGVSIQSAAVVILEDLLISDFAQQGIADIRTTPGELYIKNSVIRNNAGVGILAFATGGTSAVSIENVHAIHNVYGIATGAGNNVKITRSLFSGNSTAGIEADGGGQVGIDSSTVNFNGIGLQTAGTMWIANTDIAFNSTAIVGATTSFGNNRIYGNGAAGTAPTVGAASTDRGQQ